MLEPSTHPENPVPRWLGTSLGIEGRRDLVAMCHVEMARLKFRENMPGDNRFSAGLMPASFEALIHFLEATEAATAIRFSDVEQALAVRHTQPFVTLAGRGCTASVVRAFSEPDSDISVEDDSAGLLRSMEILTVREIVGSHYVEIAALQREEANQHSSYASQYKGHHMRPCLHNAWFFANGVVRSGYEAEQLARLAPRSQLIEHKRRLQVQFFDGLSTSLAEACQGTGSNIGQMIREKLTQSARFLGYPGLE